MRAYRSRRPARKISLILNDFPGARDSRIGICSVRSQVMSLAPCAKRVQRSQRASRFCRLRFTDGTVLSVAVASAIVSAESFDAVV